ncbi:SE1832 family protein [Marinococcus luteus]|uniref:SE1832 family protein n=1 Tax=Marinococcus luteus TaxID=1122204 RepID=UPI002ACC931D|nr:SE1832 family protein [Marinococcus luteus]MDZ5783208.1 SE1832 family protein [Marinococcus luteus]
MTLRELDHKLDMLKSDYVRIQGDLEKLESFGGNTDGIMRELDILEKEMHEINTQIREYNK